MGNSVHTTAERHHEDIAVLGTAAGTAYMNLGETVNLLGHGKPSAVGSTGTVWRRFHHTVRGGRTDKHTAKSFGTYSWVNVCVWATLCVRRQRKL